MKAGERIRRIQESAESLRPRSWSEAQLVLDRFGFDTYEPDPRYRDEFDAYDYFIRQIKKGSDDQLRSLHEYRAPSRRCRGQIGGAAPVEQEHSLELWSRGGISATRG